MMTYSIMPRGGVVHSSKLAEHLSKIGVEVELFALCNTNGVEKKDYIKFYRPLYVPYSIYSFNQQSKDVISYVKQMIEEYEKNLPKNFDIYHTHDCVGGNALYTLRKKGDITAPTIRTIHHLDSFQDKRLYDFQENAAKYCDYKFVVSKYWQHYLKENMNIDSFLTYNGVDTDLFNPDVDGQEVRQKYGIGEDPLVLFVGGLEPRKGLEYLLLAMELVLKEIPNTKLIMVGKNAFSSVPGEKTFFDVLIKRLGIEDCVKFAFDIDDSRLPEYYAACDVFVLTSRMEGWGLSLMEAMATKKPVVATKVGGIPELVENEKNGFLCNPGDVMDLANRITYLLKNRDAAKQMGGNGLATAQSYSWEKTALKVKKIYESILLK